MAWSYSDRMQIAELVAQLKEDSATTQKKLIEASHPDAGQFTHQTVALEIAKVFMGDSLHPKPEIVYETIQLLSINTRILTLSYMSKNEGIFKNKIPEQTMKRAYGDLEAILDDCIAQGDKEALQTITFIATENSTPRVLLAKARSAMFALQKSLASELPQTPTLMKKEPIYVNSSHQINIEDRWTDCTVHLERSSGTYYLTIVASFSDAEYWQQVTVKSDLNTDVEELLRRVKMAGFQEVKLQTNREWLYYTFKRDKSSS